MGIAPPEVPENNHIHLPPPSYMPLILAIGIGVLAVGLLSHLALVGIGVAVAIYGIWGWTLEPTE